MLNTPVVGARTVLVLLVTVLALAAPRLARAQEPIAVIVHPSNRLSMISLEELRRFYLGRSTTLPKGESVMLLESPEVRQRFYSAALRMSPDRIKRHWIGVVFSGESGTPPKEVGVPAELVKFVASHPNAIAFVGAGAVNGSVKILAIQGLRPGDPNYPLR